MLRTQIVSSPKKNKKIDNTQITLSLIFLLIADDERTILVVLFFTLRTETNNAR